VGEVIMMIKTLQLNRVPCLPGFILMLAHLPPVAILNALAPGAKKGVIEKSALANPGIRDQASRRKQPLKQPVYFNHQNLPTGGNFPNLAVEPIKGAMGYLGLGGNL
jgi:hypothetical protein